MRGFLLASVSSVALATTAWAGETPKATRAMAYVPPTWAGFYAGLDLGWIGNQASVAELTCCYSNSNADMTVNGFIGGGHVGYNWQFQQVVLGVETDISGAVGNRTITFFGGTPPDTFSSKINWLSTLRARAGVTFDEWLLYGTAGWAVAGVHNVRNDIVNGPFTVDEAKTKSGFVWGGGVERMLGSNWTGRVEALAVNLGSDTVTTNVVGLGSYITQFTNRAIIVRGGVSYKW